MITEPTNASRIALIESIIHQHYEALDPESSASDILTDLRHYCHDHKLGFQRLVDTSRNLFQGECEDEGVVVPEHNSDYQAIVAVIEGGALQSVMATANASDVRVLLLDYDNREAEEEENLVESPIDPEITEILETGVTIW